MQCGTLLGDRVLDSLFENSRSYGLLAYSKLPMLLKRRASVSGAARVIGGPQVPRWPSEKV